MPPHITDLSIAALSPDRLADFLAFFDGEAFSDNPDWSSCYCQCYYEDHARISWSARTGAENRHCAVKRCRAGEMRGYLAYLNGKVVGWCNAAPRHLLHALDPDPVPEPERIGCILCFLVSPDNRGTGIATALLSGACKGFSAQGFRYAEANPRPDAANPAENHFGPLGMYLSAGFSVCRTDDSDGSVWVRKDLQLKASTGL